MSARSATEPLPEREAWRLANQRHLEACVAEARARLEAHARRDSAPPAKQAAAVEQAEQAVGGRTALRTLCDRFGLTPFERGIVVLCLGAELDGDFAAACGTAAGQPQRPYPTFALAMAALPSSHWDAATADRPLRRYRLLQPFADEGLAHARLRLEERIVHFLGGTQTREERLLGVIEPVTVAPGDELAPSHHALAERIVALFTRPGVPPLLQLCGAEPAAKETVLSAACARMGLGLHLMRAVDVPLNAMDRDALARLWDRESRLTTSMLLVQCEDGDHPDQLRAAAAFAERAESFVAVASRDPLRFNRRLVSRVDVDRPEAAEQLALWHAALGPVAERLNGQLATVASQFNLTTHGMRAAAAEVEHATSGGDPAELLWDACRRQARPRLDDLAQRIQAAAGWEDIVLPAPQLQLLHDVAAHARQRSKVYEEWGFGRRGSRGLGISALFAGASGTGKTMAAEVIAAELRLDLYRVDLSQVVSKYIGETEKNLRRVFDAAEEGGTVLLFDEADALFGKRSEVKDSHDRYANLEVSYLLQRMEQYRGLAVLTTNVRSALDTAFLRRLRFIVEFPFPGPAERAEIWRRVFPAATPLDDLDYQRLARINAPGGVIRNIALSAAFLAADRGEAVAMRHLRHAVEIEFIKLERPLSEAEVGGWT